MGGMSVASKVRNMDLQLVHHRFSLEQYEEMIEHGILDSDDRVELLAGEIVEEMGEGSRHMSSVARLNRYFVTALGHRAILLPHGPIALPPDSMPELDITLAVEREDFYSSRRPLASDVLLLVEVSDSSLQKHRTLKLRIYAEAGISEYWIVNLVDNVIEVYAGPVDGRYASPRTLRPGETIAPAAFPDVAMRVSDIIP
jgi:Uma2 family endonuclease